MSRLILAEGLELSSSDRALVGVVAVVALEAVVAGEVALQRRQDRDVEL